MVHDESGLTSEGYSSTPTREIETKKQLAARLAVSTRSIDNFLRDGLPHLRLTRRLIRFPRAAVDGWLAERQVRRT